MIRRQKFLLDRTGASAVEFALIIGPLLLLLFGSIEFGRYLWTRQALQETAIAGARCLAVPQSECMLSGTYNAATARTHVQSIARGWGIALADQGVTLEPDVSCAGTSGFSRVVVSAPFNSPVPQVMTALTGAETISASACFPNVPEAG
ncbi:pilus assembly protein [Arsenicitalea aurantiaca]|uniref:Pilus assembly protein n=1 Tax=Arsenicitalea aurantiaca TaxID=1783274 RepID=A0A433X811_9HYPH|nr:TadE/TadG family type IV pilus assembly protein [Arsenicitalea aurantiaca]RUT30227.1 pilus assembly protein [Arsenicitalea aurantiaca]